MQKIFPTIEDLFKNNLVVQEDFEAEELIKGMADVLERGFFMKDEFLRMGIWKSPRPKQRYLSNSEYDIINVSKQAFKEKSEKDRIAILTRLNGVSIPVASAILTLVDPNNYGVIDIRVWKVLYLYGIVNTNQKGSGFSLDEWDEYLGKIRKYAENFNVKARNIERTLFVHHKKIQEGNLYK